MHPSRHQVDNSAAGRRRDGKVWTQQRRWPKPPRP